MTHALGRAVPHRLVVPARLSSGLDFVPIPEPELNPLYETAQSALDKSCYLKVTELASHHA